MPAQHYLSRFEVPDNSWQASVTVDGVGPTTITIPGRDYYLDSDDADESLIRAVDLQLETAFGAENFDCTYDTTTGLFSIRCTTVSVVDFDWTWISDPFRLACGYTAGWTNVATAAQVSQQLPRYQIFAESGRTNWKGDVLKFGVRRVPTRGGPVAAISTDAILTTVGPWLHRHEPYAYRASPLNSGAKVGTGSAGEETWTWLDFFTHHSSGANCGQPFRLYDAVGGDIDDQIGEYVLLGEDDFDPDTLISNNFRYWTIKVECQEYTAP